MNGTLPRASHEASVKISTSLARSFLPAACRWLPGSSYLGIKYPYSTCPCRICPSPSVSA